MQNGPYDPSQQPPSGVPGYGTPMAPPPPGHPYPAPTPAPKPRSGNRTLIIVLSVVVAGALVVCGGGAAAAIFYFKSRIEEPVAQPARPARPVPAFPTTAPARPEPSSEAPPAPMAKDQTFQGRGSKVIPLTALPATIQMLKMTHSGSQGFAVTALNDEGRTVGLLGSSYGRYEGTLMLNGDETPAVLKVRASGAWKLVVQDARKAPVWNGKASGNKPTVLRVTEQPDPLAAVSYSHKGKRNFVIRSYGGGTWDLPVNEIGPVSGETTLAEKTDYIEIVADGAWTFGRS